MRNLKLCCIGTLPLWVGVILNSILTVLPIPVYFFSIAFLVLWGWLCRKCCARQESIVKQALYLSLFGFAMLALVLLQELILGRYWVSYFGLATQLYFMPGLALFGVFLTPFMEQIVTWPIYLVEMIGLFLTALLGCWLKCRKK